MSIKKGTFDNPSTFKTIIQSIYYNLKDPSFSNKLKANQHIIEKETAKMFHVTAAHVQKVLFRLAAERYFFIDSYRKTVAKEIS